MKALEKAILFSTATLWLSISLVSAQTALTGTVSDTTGGVLPGATVDLIRTGTGATRTAVSGDDGVYGFRQLEPGAYRVEVSLTGFKKSIQENLDVPVGITTTLNVMLELGDLMEEIVVEAGASTLNTVDASLGAVISGVQVLNLPSESLDPAGLLSLQPGVTWVPSAADVIGGYSGAVDEDGRTGSVNGARSDQTNITLDGVDVNDPQNGYAFSGALRATQASLQEFRVTTSNYNPELGRSSSAQIQLVTKSGTNDIHGQFYYHHRNEAFAANDFFNNKEGVERGKLRRHIYGVAMGGPIIKNRLFLFGNFERLEHAENATVLRDIPSMTYRDGVMLYRCADPSQCPGGTVQGLSNTHSIDAGFFGLSPSNLSQIDPLGIGPNPGVMQYASQYPVPNAKGNKDGFNLAGFRWNAPLNNDYKTFIARLDFNIDEDGNHALYARGTLQDDSIVSTPAAFPGQEPKQLMLGNSKGLALGYKAVVSPTLLNTARFGYTWIGESFSGIRNSEYNDLRFIDEYHGYDDADTITPTSTRARKLPTYHIRDDMSWIRGEHSFSFGMDFRFVRNDRFSNLNSYSQYQSNPSWLGGLGANLMPGDSGCINCEGFPAVADAFTSSYRDSIVTHMGIMTQIDGIYNYTSSGDTLASGTPVPRRYAVNEYEFYFQDQWRVIPNLTLTFGLRYSNSTPPWETRGQQVSPTPGLNDWFETRRSLMLAGLPTNDAGPISFDLSGPVNNGPHYYERDNNNFSPRMAFAWSPKADSGFFGWLSGNGRLVLRGGYSLVYDRIGNGIATSFDQNGSFGMSTNITSPWSGCDEGFNEAPAGVCPRFTTPFDTAPSQGLRPPAPPGGFPQTPPEVFAITQALDSSIKTPYAHAFNLSLQRQLPNDFMVEAAYVGRRGRSLLLARDVANYSDLVDPQSGVGFFDAMKDLIRMGEQGVNVNDVGAIPFWENFFPSWGPSGINEGYLASDAVPGFTEDPGYSASQVAYSYVNGEHPDTTVVPFVTDIYGWPGYATCAGGEDVDGDGIPDCPYTMYGPQYGTLNALSSIARSEYHALQLTLSKRFGSGLAFGLNYTLSHATDHGSQPERASPVAGDFEGGGYTGSTINPWNPDLEWGNADFDMRHQFNGNWYHELPFGKGRRFGGSLPAFADHILGGWNVSGIIRVNSGQVANVINARIWPTNWNLQGNATCTGTPVADPTHSTQYGPCPQTQNVKSGIGADGQDRGPNIFARPDDAHKSFRYTLPGDRGERNVLRGDKYVGLDFAVGKEFGMPWEGHVLKFRWEVFNLTNSAYFDTNSINLDIAGSEVFGDYTAMLGAPRRMQFGLRYEF